MTFSLRLLPALFAGILLSVQAQSAETLGAGLVAVEPVAAATDLKIHTWETEDPMRTAVIAIETKNALVGVEGPAFKNDFALWKDYLAKTGKPLTALLLSSHPGEGSGWYGKAETLATEAGKASMTNGPVRAMMTNLKTSFGADFEADFMPVMKTLPKDQPVDVAGLRVIAHDAHDGTIFVFPDLKVAYMHMFSRDFHSILPGKAVAEGFIADLEYVKNAGVTRILTSHHEPEDASAIDEKLEYVRFVIKAADEAKDAAAFKAAVKAKYPTNNGDHYLDWSAAGFFPAKN